MAGSSTSAPASPGAIRAGCAFGSFQSRCARAGSWSRELIRRSLFQCGSRATTWWSRRAVDEVSCRYLHVGRNHGKNGILGALSAVCYRRPTCGRRFATAGLAGPDRAPPSREETGMSATDSSAKSAQPAGMFSVPLAESDPEVADAIGLELGRQRDEIELIASENIVSRAVLEAQGSVLTNKYAEGLPGRRYYGGCQYVDIAERLAIERVTRLFGCGFANVQPHSGASANAAAFMALMAPGDTFLGLNLAAGGHLTHGSPVNMSGRWFKPVPYGVRRDDHRIDFDEVQRLAREHKPKVIIAGGSAYPRIIDFRRFREIADEVGAKLLVDMAHFAGLVAGGAHPSPFPHAHVVTSTAHKTLRGPRSGFILTNSDEVAKKINAAVFPGLQGGPLMHVIAAKAVAFGEALRPAFKLYARSVIANAKALAETLRSKGLDIVSGGTDTHLILVDLRPKRLTGKVSELALGRAHIACNKNGVPFEPQKPAVTSGVRLGTPAGTSRGFGIAEFQEVGELIVEVLEPLSQKGIEEDAFTEAAVREKVKKLVSRFPIYTG